MPQEKITTVTGRGVHVPGSDIDTDRIIPARFMKCVTFDGLGEHLFHDVRYDADGNEKPHPLNEDRFQDASVLLTGVNFGCGSSREHAPQALYRWGIRAIIAESYADIFFGNCTTLGVPCVVASKEDIEKLSAAVEAKPTMEITIDVEANRVRYGDGQDFPVHIVESAREALISGKWDPIVELLEVNDAIEKTADALPYMSFRP